MLYNFRRERGQSIVESLVALGVLTVGFLGLVGLLARSFSLNRTVSDTHIATYLAAEGIESVKNLIDANILQDVPWGTGLAPGDYEGEYRTCVYPYDCFSLTPYQGRFLRFDPAANVYSYSGAEQTRFTRRIRIENIGGEELVVSSFVNWTGPGGGNFTVRLQDHFLKWRQQ